MDTTKEEKRWEDRFKEDWEPLLMTDGKYDRDKIINEMHDLVFVLDQISEVYCYITGGTLSKAMYYASTIKTAYDDAVNESSKVYAEDYIKKKEDDIRAEERTRIVREIEGKSWWDGTQREKCVTLSDAIYIVQKDDK